MVRLAVGIPTRNRADLAMAAIESVLRAEQADVTVLVSDNSTDPHERARLEEFCADLPTGLVDYVRPPKPLGMPAHWEWLWHRIRDGIGPSHVAYLTDRLVFADGALAQLLEIVSRHPEHVVSYQFDSVQDAGTPVEVLQAQWTGRLLELDSRRVLELSSRGEFGEYFPRLMNSIAPTAVMAAIERRFGDLMGRVSPDYRFAFRCLALCDSILYLDRSAVIEHGMARSAGGNFLRGRMNDDARRFVSDLEVERFGETPEPGFETTANAIFQEYCTVRAEAEQGRFPPPDWRSYLAANAVAVDRIEDPEWRGRMRDLLERRGWTRRHAAGRALHLAGRMAAHLVRHPRALARTVKRQLWDRPPGTPTAVLLRRVGIDPRLRDLRFDSAADALAHAVAHPRARTPDAWHLDALRRAGAIVAQRNLEPAGIAHERR